MDAPTTAIGGAAASCPVDMTGSPESTVRTTYRRVGLSSPGAPVPSSRRPTARLLLRFGHFDWAALAAVAKFARSLASTGAALDSVRGVDTPIHSTGVSPKMERRPVHRLLPADPCAERSRH